MSPLSTILGHLSNANLIQQCTAANPACTCTYCTVNFHCPRCIQKPDVKKKCRFDAETKARLEAELLARQKLEREKAGRSQADELAGAVFEFFKSLYTDDHEDDGPSITHQEIVDLVHQNPIAEESSLIPSPDSITVTTVFGVHEEPNNTTVISGPSDATHHQLYAAEEHQDADLNLVEHMLQEGDYEFSESEIDELLAGGVDNSNIDSILDNDVDSVDNDDGDDGDADTDDFDAESAVIDEFFDDGGLTPTATTHPSNI